MSERIDIINMALILCGEERITSIEDDTLAAQIMKTNYDLAKKATLEAEEWSFAINRFILAPEAAGPEYEWEYKFRIPAGVLRVLTVDKLKPHYNYNRGMPPDRRQIAYEVEHNSILCDDEKIYMRGLVDIEEEGRYSNLFAIAFAHKLAVLSVYALTQSNSKMQAIMAMYGAAVQEAASNDGKQGRTRRMRNTTLSRVR